MHSMREASKRSMQEKKYINQQKHIAITSQNYIKHYQK